MSLLCFPLLEHAIKNYMANATGTSGWTKTSYWELTAPLSLQEPSTSDAKECMQRRWCKYRRWRPRHDRIRWSAGQEATFVHSRSREIAFHSPAPQSAFGAVKMPWSRPVSLGAVLTSVFCNWIQHRSARCCSRTCLLNRSASTAMDTVC